MKKMKKICKQIWGLENAKSRHLKKYKGFSRENLQFLIVFKIYSWVGKFKLSAAVLVNWNVVALGTVIWKSTASVNWNSVIR